MISRNLVAKPSIEPLTLAQAKDHLRESGVDQDALIAGLITAAREHAEGFTWRAFIDQTWDLFLDKFPKNDGPIILPLPPLQSVTSLKYTDTAGVQQTLATADYTVDANAEPGRIVPVFGTNWPAVRNEINAVEVRFIAGFGPAGTDIPQPIVQAMLFQIGHLYENREAVVIGTIASQVPMAAESLLWPYRMLEL